MRVLTWNVQGSDGLDVDAVAQHIRGQSLDVVALQEVQRRQAARLASGAGDARPALGPQALAGHPPRRGPGRADAAPHRRRRARSGSAADRSGRGAGGSGSTSPSTRAPSWCGCSTSTSRPTTTRSRGGSRPRLLIDRAGRRRAGAAGRRRPQRRAPPRRPRRARRRRLDRRLAAGPRRCRRGDELDVRRSAGPAADAAHRLRAWRRRARSSRMRSCSTIPWSSSVPCPITCRSWPRCACRKPGGRASDGRRAAARQGAQAPGQGRGDAEPARGRRLRGQGGGADRRPPHRHRPPRRRRAHRGAEHPLAVDRAGRLRAGPAGAARRRRRQPRLRAGVGVEHRRGAVAKLAGFTSDLDATVVLYESLHLQAASPDGGGAPGDAGGDAALAAGVPVRVRGPGARDPRRGPPRRRGAHARRRRAPRCPTCPVAPPRSASSPRRRSDGSSPASAPAAAVAGGWERGHREASSADVGRARLAARPQLGRG